MGYADSGSFFLDFLLVQTITFAFYTDPVMRDIVVDMSQGLRICARAPFCMLLCKKLKCENVDFYKVIRWAGHLIERKVHETNFIRNNRGL